MEVVDDTADNTIKEIEINLRDLGEIVNEPLVLD